MSVKNKSAAKTEDKQIKEIIQTLFDLLTIEGDFKVSVEEDTIELALETENMGIIIGRHGEMLESLQVVLSLCVSKKLGRFMRVSVEVGDYKKNRTEYLLQLAEKTKERALDEGREITLSNLKSWERRIIHMQFSEDKDVVSESSGEGRDRVLVVRPRE